MFSTNKLVYATWVFALAGSVAYAQPQAQTKVAAAHVQTASVHMSTADIDMGASAAVSPNAVPPSASVAASRPAAQPVTGATPRLSIDDIDQITRTKIARQLSGNQPESSLALNAPAPAVATAPVQAAPPVVVMKETPRTRSESVRFVAAFSDMTGMSVLYEFRGASYPAHVGAKLLNGWTVKQVDGFVVTVADGKRTWTETISGGSPEATEAKPAAFVPGRQLSDLGGPLPSGMPVSAMGR